MQSKYTLLQCASPDAIARLPATKLKYDAEKLWTKYFRNQKHGSLKDYMVHCLQNKDDAENNGSLVQVSFLMLNNLYSFILV
jgi:capsid portal protein